MIPLMRSDHNFVYYGPTDEIGDLSCRVDGIETFSHWRPSEEELELLNRGGSVELGITGHPIPPVRINVVEANMGDQEKPFKLPRPQRPQG
jgi:hypothetical protein